MYAYLCVKNSDDKNITRYENKFHGYDEQFESNYSCTVVALLKLRKNLNMFNRRLFQFVVKSVYCKLVITRQAK